MVSCGQCVINGCDQATCPHYCHAVLQHDPENVGLKQRLRRRRGHQG